ncbi:MAG: hypothetical protein LQ342_008253 [Letrouitia transgressa]|nr:MAG: hypothetical protein LQ342_008253 [Letrouitia transgressa]
MNVPALQNLPPELLALIFGYTAQIVHLKSLCLVCRTVSEVATSLLYKDLVLQYRPKHPEWSKCRDLLFSKGLRYTRTVSIGNLDFDQKEPCRFLDDLLPRLPKNAITEFRFGSHGRPTGKQLRYLWQTQKNLRNLQLDFNVFDPSPKDLVERDHGVLQALERIEKINLDLADTVDPEMLDKLLRSMNLKNLRQVEFRLLQFRHINGEESPDQDGMDAAWGRVFRCHIPAALTNLILTYVRIPDARYLEFDRFPYMKSLELRACQNTAPVLNWFQKPTLRSLRFCQRFDEEHGLKHFWRFLSRFDTLEELIFQYQDRWGDPTTENQIYDAISKHSKTLKSLLLSRRPMRPRTGDEPCDVFQRVAEKCHNLHQLGLEMYGCKIDSDPEKLVLNFPRLRTLNLFHTEGVNSRDTNFLAYKQVAAQCFQSVAERGYPLCLVAFGYKSRFGDNLQYLESRNKGQELYARGPVQRKPRFVANSRGEGQGSSTEQLRRPGLVWDYTVESVEQPNHMAKHIEPECNLLDYRFELDP